MFFPDLLDHASRHGQMALTQRGEQLALMSVVVASALVIVSSFVKTMIPVRWLAVGNNIGVVVWGFMHASYPTLALHSILLPINFYRLLEMIRLTQRVRAATSDPGLSGVWLRPYMRAATLPAGRCGSGKAIRPTGFICWCPAASIWSRSKGTWRPAKSSARSRSSPPITAAG